MGSANLALLCGAAAGLPAVGDPTPDVTHVVFLQTTAVLVLAAVVGFVGSKLKQPLIVSFIAVGILVGPQVLDLIRDPLSLKLFAEIGISVLLFIVGLKLDLVMIRTMGRVAVATGLGQVVFTSLGGFAIARLLGMEVVASIYVAVALTFSSTIIIVKLLSDKREVDALHGRIAIGFLIVQDLAVVLAMIALSAFGAGEGEQASLAGELVRVLVAGIAFVVGVVGLSRWGLARLLQQLARLPELLVLFAVAWAVGLAAVGEWLGFSKEVGAFLAGVSIASTPFRDAIGARLVSLRDFLLLFFFIHLGAGLDLGRLGGEVVPAVVFSIFVLIGNPLIVMAIMGVMGYRKRTGFLAGLTVAQISEFSLILVGLGATLGHIDQNTVALVTLVGLVTLVAVELDAPFPVAVLPVQGGDGQGVLDPKAGHGPPRGAAHHAGILRPGVGAVHLQTGVPPPAQGVPQPAVVRPHQAARLRPVAIAAALAGLEEVVPRPPARPVLQQPGGGGVLPEAAHQAGAHPLAGGLLRYQVDPGERHGSQ